MRSLASSLLFLVSALLAGSAAHAAPAPAQACIGAARAAAEATGLPAQTLVTLALAETGRRGPDGPVPWPWTVNAAGEGRWFDTREEALAFVRAKQAAGVRSIDVGCFQINLVWHGDAFASLEEAFDPTANAAYAARFLKRLADEAGLARASGHYHSRTPELAQRYRARLATLETAAAALLETLPPEGARSFARAPNGNGIPLGGVSLAALFGGAGGKSLLTAARGPLFGPARPAHGDRQ